MEYKTVYELITEGSNKFKLGLVWYFIHRYFGGELNYQYWIKKLSEDEIRERMDSVLAIIRWTKEDKEDGQSPSNEKFSVISSYILNDMKSYIHIMLAAYLDENNERYRMGKWSEADYLAENIYKIFIHRLAIGTKVHELVCEAVRCIVKNYKAAGEVEYEDEASLFRICGSE